jgi:hypothetical protein
MNDTSKKGQKLSELQAYIIETAISSNNVSLQFRKRKFAEKGTHMYISWLAASSFRLEGTA